MTFGLTPYGFVAKRLVDIKTDLENAMIAEFGEVNVEPQSVFGQLIGVLSKTAADVWDNMEAVYNSQYPATAEGTSLDNVVALNGITRLPAERTRVIGICNGEEGTLINENSLARIPSSGQVFYSEEDVTITTSNAGYAQIQLIECAAQVYNILINSVQFSYSLPTITFDANFVTGNSIVVTLNGTQLSAVPFNTSNNQTLADLATAIQAFTAVDSAVATNPDTIDITPVNGSNVVVNSIVISGGASQPGYTISYRVPPAIISFDADFVTGNSIVITLNGVALSSVPFNSDQATTAGDIVTLLEAQSEIDSVALSGANRVFTITPNDGEVVVFNSAVVTGGASQATATIENPVLARIAEIIDNGSQPVDAADEGFGTMTLTADEAEVPFALTVGTNLQVIDRSSPVVFLAQVYGEIPAPANTLTEILTPIAGWNSVNNPEDGVLGRLVETDSELRIRRRNSIRLLGAGTVESIRARILQQVSGVTACLVFENRTMQQNDCALVFSEDLVTSNVINATVNTTAISPVTFSSDHATTMQLIADELELITDLVLSATVGGVGNRTITIVPVNGVEITNLSGVVTMGASQATVTSTLGRYPKSIECVVQGGTNQDVADKIWETKPAGIQTFGSTSVNVTDSQGGTQVINFSRPTLVYIWVTAALTLYTEETFPSNGVDLVAQAIKDYGDTLTIGEDVLFQRVECQVFEVEGIGSVSMTVGASYLTSPAPSGGTSNITIAENELSDWSLDRITVTVP